MEQQTKGRSTSQTSKNKKRGHDLLSLSFAEEGKVSVSVSPSSSRLSLPFINEISTHVHHTSNKFLIEENKNLDKMKTDNIDHRIQRNSQVENDEQVQVADAETSLLGKGLIGKEDVFHHSNQHNNTFVVEDFMSKSILDQLNTLRYKNLIRIRALPPLKEFFEKQYLVLPIAPVKERIKEEILVLQELEHDLQQQQQQQQYSAISSSSNSSTSSSSTYHNTTLQECNSKNNCKKLMTSSEVPIVMIKACEMLIQELTLRACQYTVKSHHRRTIKKIDICEAISECDTFDFLIDTKAMTDYYGTVKKEK